MKKKTVFIVIPVIAFIIAFVGVFFYFNSVDKKTNFTLSEKKWLEENSKEKIDFDIVNNYPVYGTDGEGVFFDYVKNLENKTGLLFNKVPVMDTEKAESAYSIRILNNDEELGKNDLLIFSDSYVAIGKETMTITREADIANMKLGVLNDDMSEISYYLKSSNNVSYVSYDDINKLYKGLDDKKVDLIVVPYIRYLDKIVASTDYYVNYYFTDLSKKAVLTLNSDNKTLNSIIKKHFEKWKNNNYVDSYNNELLNYYLDKNDVSDKIKTELISKSYVYGYVENVPYEVTKGSSVEGIAMEYINRMSRLSDIEFTYKKYDNIEDLKTAITNKEVDVYFDYYGLSNVNYTATVSPFIESYVVLGKVSDDHIVTSFESIKNEKVNMLSSSLVTKYFEKNSRADINKVKKVKDLVDKKSSNMIAVDKEVYSYYKNSTFKNYEVLYTDVITSEYSFKVKNDDETFYKLFNYIINTNSYYKYRNSGLSNLMTTHIDTSSFSKVLISVFIILLIILGIIIGMIAYTKNKKKEKKVKKEERVKYTDLLTALKNRNYLNLNINKWDDCKVLPQSIIMIDLNNVQYVNDNHGYEAGDDLIVKAASVLVNTQLENSEIIRTNGNEFLIYTIGYSEHQIENYTKKLTKELKKLPYGFGASIGFSMIKDDIKTIDDAISEATLEMKSKKEDYK